MKKLSVILLALAIAAFAVPALAGDVAMDGEYTFGGESWSNDVSDDYGLFYDELDLDIEVSMGDVLFHWDVEVTDDPWFDRSDDEGGLNSDDTAPGQDNKIVDGMWVKWQATDAFSVKFGEYGWDGPNNLVTDGPGGGSGTIGLMYSLDVADLSFYLSRDDEGNRTYVDGVSTFSREEDVTTMGLIVEGAIGPVDAGLLYTQTTDEMTDDVDTSLVEVWGEFSVGPVGVWLDYGSVGADDSAGVTDGGTILNAEFGLDDLVGFGLTIGLVQTNEDYDGSPYADDWDVVKIYGDEWGDAMMVYLGAEYGVNDKLTVGLDALLMNDVDSDDGPTEIDVWAGYSFADNVSVEAGYAMQTANDGDAVGYEDQDLMWYELVFGFWDPGVFTG